MNKAITPNDIANEVCMTLDANKAIIYAFVEANDDEMFYKKFMATDICFKAVYGKKEIIDVVKILKKRARVSRTVSFLDKDFGRLCDGMYYRDNIFYTDTHDWETLVIQSDGFSKILHQYSLNKNPKDVREKLIACCLPIGFFRYLSMVTKMGLTFKSIDCSSFISGATLELDLHKLYDEVKKISLSTDMPTKKEMVAKIKKMCSSNKYPPWIICCGHDMVKVLLMAFKSCFGNKKAEKLDMLTLCSSLISAYGFENFKMTNMCAFIKRYEKKARVAILSAPPAPSTSSN